MLDGKTENGNRIRIGEYQELLVVNRKEHGIYLGASEDAKAADRVLLPAKQVPQGIREGMKLRVFVYRDSGDRLIATTAEPLITLHQVARLRVAELTKIGAFLAWGLEKDLLLPFHEQTKKLKKGEEVLCALYVDKTGRLAATMKIYPYLRTDSPYRAGDQVEGTLYQVSENFGSFVAVDDIYSALIPRREEAREYLIGEKLALRVTKVHEDGKLDVSAREKAYIQMEPDAEKILHVIRTAYDGALPFDDRADPDTIRDAFGMSKAAFKRAAGKLYRERRIDISDGKIKIVE